MAQPVQNPQGMLTALDSQITPPQQNQQAQQQQNANQAQQAANQAAETQRNQAMAAQGVGQNVNSQA